MICKYKAVALYISFEIDYFFCVVDLCHTIISEVRNYFPNFVLLQSFQLLFSARNSNRKKERKAEEFGGRECALRSKFINEDAVWKNVE